MTAFELLEAMGGIGEKYLNEHYDAKKERMKLIRAFTAAVASVVLISGIGIGIFMTSWRTDNAAESAGDFEYFGTNETQAAAVTEDACEPETGNTSALDGADLPELSFTEFAGGHGMEALMAYNIDEIIGSNPWSKECTLTSLPVYRNLTYHADYYASDKGYTADELLAIAEEIAAKMGTEIVSHEFSMMQVGSKDGVSEYLTAIDAQTALCSIYISVNGIASVRIDENSPGKPTDEKSALAVYGDFAGLLEFEEPTADIVTDYNIYGEAGHEIHVWDGAGDERDRILGFAFDTVMLSATDSWYGINLGTMYAKKELIGEYPIITWEDAAEMLLAGKYISTVPDDTFGRPESYEHVELVYRTHDETIMPYYKFRVHLEEWDDMHFAGEKHFGAYYVPAVSSDYLDEASFWDGTFN